MPPGVSRRIRAAASSIASGSPSRAWQTATTAAVFVVVRVKSGLTARARSTKSSTAGDEEDGIRRERVEPHERGRRIDDLLEVVEHDEHAPAAEGEPEPLLQGAVAGVPHAEPVRDRRQQEGRLEHVL